MNNSTGPVFLLAGGGRTGSTLIQRLILSTRHVMMWGGNTAASCCRN